MRTRGVQGREPYIQQAMTEGEQKRAHPDGRVEGHARPPSTQSKSRVARSRKPISCFTRTIQGPGRGTNAARPVAP